MADGFKIADGYVEVHGVVDRRAVIAAADGVTRGVSDQMTTGVAFGNLRTGGRRMGAVLGEHAGPSAAKHLTAGLAASLTDAITKAMPQIEDVGKKLGTSLGRASGSTFVEEIIREIDRRTEAGFGSGKDGQGGEGGDSGRPGESGKGGNKGRPGSSGGDKSGFGQGGQGGKGGDADGKGIGTAMGIAALQGFVQAFTGGLKGAGSLIANNQILGTVAIGLGVTLGILAAPAFGSAFAAAITGGAGLGVIGLGAYLLRDDPKVKAAADKLGKTASTTFNKAAQPMRDPLVRALGIFEQLIIDIGPDLEDMFRAIAPAIEPLARGLSGFVKEALPGFIDLIKAAEPFLSDLENTLPRFGEHVGKFFSIISEAGPSASLFFRDFLHILGILLITFGYFIEGMSRMYAMSREIWAAIGQLFKMAALGLWAIIKDIIGFFGRLKDFIAGVWRAIRGDVADTIKFFKEMPGKIVNALSGIPGKIKAIFAGAGQWLIDAGKNIISGLVNGIKNMIPNLSGLLGTVTNMIPDWKGPPARDRELLEPTGRMIMEGLGRGLGAGAREVRDQLGAMTASLPAAAVPAATPSVTPGPIVININTSISRWSQVPDETIAQLDAALNRYRRGYA